MTTQRFIEPYPVIHGSNGPVEITDIDQATGECSTRHVEMDDETGETHIVVGTMTLSGEIMTRFAASFSVVEPPEPINENMALGGAIEMKRSLLAVGNARTKKKTKKK